MSAGEVDDLRAALERSRAWSKHLEGQARSKEQEYKDALAALEKKVFDLELINSQQTERLAKARAADVQNSMTAVDQLKTQVAAKDAEITGLKGRYDAEISGLKGRYDVMLEAIQPILRLQMQGQPFFENLSKKFGETLSEYLSIVPDDAGTTYRALNKEVIDEAPLAHLGEQSKNSAPKEKFKIKPKAAAPTSMAPPPSDPPQKFDIDSMPPPPIPRRIEESPPRNAWDRQGGSMRGRGGGNNQRAQSNRPPRDQQAQQQQHSQQTGAQTRAPQHDSRPGAGTTGKAPVSFAEAVKTPARKPEFTKHRYTQEEMTDPDIPVPIRTKKKSGQSTPPPATTQTKQSGSLRDETVNPKDRNLSSQGKVELDPPVAEAAEQAADLRNHSQDTPTKSVEAPMKQPDPTASPPKAQAPKGEEKGPSKASLQKPENKGEQTVSSPSIGSRPDKDSKTNQAESKKKLVAGKQAPQATRPLLPANQPSVSPWNRASQPLVDRGKIDATAASSHPGNLLPKLSDAVPRPNSIPKLGQKQVNKTPGEDMAQTNPTDPILHSVPRFIQNTMPAAEGFHIESDDDESVNDEGPTGAPAQIASRKEDWAAEPETVDEDVGDEESGMQPEVEVEKEIGKKAVSSDTGKDPATKAAAKEANLKAWTTPGHIEEADAERSRAVAAKREHDKLSGIEEPKPTMPKFNETFKQTKVEGGERKVVGTSHHEHFAHREKTEEKANEESDEAKVGVKDDPTGDVGETVSDATARAGGEEPHAEEANQEVVGSVRGRNFMRNQAKKERQKQAKRDKSLQAEEP